jgi:hypothetical protein
MYAVAIYWQQENMTNKDTHYLSFLLRLWLADDDGEPARRVSIESPLTGERKGFANLDELCRYLHLLTEIESEDTQNETGQH